MRAEESRQNLGEGPNERIETVIAITGARWSTKATLRNAIYTAIESVEWDALLKSYREHIDCAGKYTYTFERFVNDRGWEEDWIERKKKNAEICDPEGSRARRNSEAGRREARKVTEALGASKRDSAAPEEIGAVMGDIAKNLLRGGKPCTT